MLENTIEVLIVEDETTFIDHIQWNLDQATMVLANRAEFSPEFIMHCIIAKCTNSATLELAQARALKHKRAMAHMVGRKQTRTTTVSQDAKLVAKAIGASTSKVVKPTIYQGGLCSPR